MDRQQHWNAVYGTKGERHASWFEASPAISLELIEAAGLTTDTCVLDVGGGDAHLVDVLLSRGVTCVAVLDVAGAALERVKARLGESASAVTWIESDVTADWSWKAADIWHDRAIFHFLTSAGDRARYKERLSAGLKAGGSAIIATFAPEGPEKCSGLPVVRYSPDTLASELGDPFVLVDCRRHLHTTPWGAVQAFQYSRFTRR